MPELPEVETVTKEMAQKLVNKRIQYVHVRRYDLRWPIPKNFEQAMQGALIKNITRRAKYILIETDTENGMLWHLGMSGRVKISEQPSKPPIYEKHDHVQIILDDGTWVRYFDPRRFGTIQLVNNHDFIKNALLGHLGCEPLSLDFKGQLIKAAVANKKAPIKNLIMDQRLVVGVGNIYACEALFDAKINPNCPGHEITKSKADTLCLSIKKVLANAIKAGGSTLKDYRKSDGSLGYFQYQFNVYDQAGQGCKKCAAKIVRITQAGRSTFYCPKCQK